MPLHPVAPDRFRAVMGHFATGVAVITASGPEGPVGMTANAVSALSLEPVLALVCFDQGARTLRVVRDTKRFGVNMLAAGQEPLAHRFASKALAEAEKFTGVAHTVHDGIPVLADGLAWVGCELTDLVPGGDHVIGIGRVVAAETGEGTDPLVWFRGRYGAFAT